MKLFDKTAPTKFTVHGNDDEGNALITGKLKVSSVFDEIPKSADSVIGEGTIFGQGLIIGEQGVISPQLGEHGCGITSMPIHQTTLRLQIVLSLCLVQVTRKAIFLFLTMKKL